MVAKSNMPNVNRLLLLLLFNLAFFNLLVHAKTFEVSNKIKSAKAIVGTDKKLDGSVTFISNDYDEINPKLFDLIVGDCKWVVKARKNSAGNSANFEFSDGKNSKNVDDPKSFLVIERGLIFKSSDGDERNVNCDKGIKFIPMEKDPKKLTVEFKLEGDFESFALTSKYLSYDESAESEKNKVNVIFWICIGVGGLLVLLLIISSVVGGVCIFIKCRKKKAAKEVLKTARELTEQQEPTKDQPSAKSTKPAKKTRKAKATQKFSVRETQAKPVSEIQPQTETMKPKSVEVEEKRSKVEEFLDPNDPFNKISDPDRRRWARQCAQMILEDQEKWEAEKAAKERERKEREAMKTAKEEKELSKTQTVEKTAEKKTTEEDKTQTLVSKTQTQVDKTQEDKSR